MWKRKSAAATCQAALANFTIHSKSSYSDCDFKRKKKKTHNLLAPICQLLMLLPQGITECFANSTNKKSSIYRNTANLQEGHGGMKWKRRKRAQQE